MTRLASHITKKLSPCVYLSAPPDIGPHFVTISTTILLYIFTHNLVNFEAIYKPIIPFYSLESTYSLDESGVTTLRRFTCIESSNSESSSASDSTSSMATSMVSWVLTIRCSRLILRCIAISAKEMNSWLRSRFTFFLFPRLELANLLL